MEFHNRRGSYQTLKKPKPETASEKKKPKKSKGGE
jgi:hypothetical protein